jgi:hypothetical protein
MLILHLAARSQNCGKVLQASGDANLKQPDAFQPSTNSCDLFSDASFQNFYLRDWRQRLINKARFELPVTAICLMLKIKVMSQPTRVS